MPPPLAYKARERLSSDSTAEVWVAEVAGRADPVWIKRHRGASGVARAEREAELLRAISGPGVVELLDIVFEGSDRLLVLEPAPGESLRARIERGPLCAEEVVTIGAGLAATLARLQTARIVHLGLSTECIFVDGTDVQIVDFGFARPLGETEDAATGERLGLHALLYHAPEQTGRMAVGVDSRSDLYALGACLHHAATGEPPFEPGDRLALVHAHIARQPRRPVDVRADLPPTLSRIISKLLHKGPEDRYQTAAALERDLIECRDQLARHGRIDDELILATADAPFRPLFSKRLYGRDREVEALERACAEACEGRGNTLFLAGQPGIGKSSLVTALSKPLANAGGYLAQGKFDLYRRDVPYSGIADALDGVIHQLLTEDDARLEMWSASLEAAVGPIAGALIEQVPDLALVIPDAPKAERLPPRQTLARLSLATQRLLHALASEEHPLVLFLDDLQWADGASRDILKSLFAGPALPYVLFVGAYRENEVDRDHPLSRLKAAIEAAPTPTTTLTLGALDEESCAEMLADALGRQQRDVEELAKKICQKTARNPLLINQYVSHLYDLGLIHFEAGTGWVWDEDAIDRAAIAEGAIALLAARIERLPAGVRRTLELAACVGDEFDLRTLCALTDQERSALESALFTLCDEGLVAPSRGGFRFVHDRIREAAQQTLTPEKRGQLHYRAAELLLANTPSADLEARAFEIADHLNLGAAFVPNALRPRIIELNQRAGERALRAGAGNTAYRYFSTALDHLAQREVDAASSASSAELHLQAAESALQIADYPAAERWLDAVRHAELPRLLAGRINAIYMQMLAMKGTSENDPSRLEEVATTLARFGVRWPMRPSRLRTRLCIWYTDWLLRGALDERAMCPVSGDPSEWLPALLILGAAGPMLQVRSAISVCEISAFSLRCYLRHGYVGTPGLALAGYAAFRRVAIGHLRGMDRLADAALEWAERAPDPVMSLRTHHLVYAFAYAWTRPRREVIEPLGRTIERMGEAGDRQYQLFTGAAHCTYMGLCGLPLDRVEAELRATATRTTRTPLTAFESLADTCRALREELPSSAFLDEKTDQVVEEFNTIPATRMSPWAFWLLVVCTLGRYDLAKRICDAADPWVFEVGAANSHVADYVLFRAVTTSALATDRRVGSRASPRAMRRLVGRSLRQLRGWGRYGPDFRHMALWLAAESDHMRGHATSALARYDEAATQARDAGYDHHAGCIWERSAELTLAMHRPSEADDRLERAARAFEAWGAHAKARQLRGDHRAT